MSVALDVAIGIVFLYLLLALVVTTLQELIASLFRLRARHLYDAIAGMLEGTAKPGATKEPLRALFEHPLIRNLTDERLKLGRKGQPSLRSAGLPSYIPSRTFALALLDVLRGTRTASDAVGASQVLSEGADVIKDLPESDTKQALQLLLGDAKSLSASADERAKLVSQRLETWFNDRMARASGWYKRKAQVWSLAIAGVVTLAANADTIHAVNRLWSDAALRAAVVASAQKFVDAQPPTPVPAPEGGQPAPAETRALAQLALRQAQELESSLLPVGWKWEPKSASPVPCARLESDEAANKGSGTPKCWQPFARDYAFLVAGWSITALAVSLGAAFWFDVLSKALQLRGSGPRVSETTGKIESS